MNRRLVILLFGNVIAVAALTFLMLKGIVQALPWIPVFWAVLIVGNLLYLFKPDYVEGGTKTRSFLSRWFPWGFAVVCLAVLIGSVVGAVHGQIDAAIRFGGALIWLVFLCWIILRRRSRRTQFEKPSDQTPWE